MDGALRRVAESVFRGARSTTHEEYVCKSGWQLDGENVGPLTSLSSTINRESKLLRVSTFKCQCLPRIVFDVRLWIQVR